MRKWIIVLAAAVLAAAPAAAQAKTGTKPAEASKTAPAAVTPAAAEPVRSAAPASGSPHPGTIGAQLAFGANWMTQSPSIGLSYYLSRDLEIQTLTTVSLQGATRKDNIAASSTESSQPSFTLIGAGLFEDRVSSQLAWSWGPVAGFQMAGSESKSGGNKSTTGSFDLVAGAGAQMKFFLVPQVAVFANLQLLLDWTLSSTAVDTLANGTKTGDTSASGFSLSTSTSNIGIAVYLN